MTAAGVSTGGGVVEGPRGGEQSSQRPVEQQTRHAADPERRQARPATSTARPVAGTRARTAADVVVAIGFAPIIVVVVVVVGGAVVDGGADAADAADGVDGARRRALAAPRSAPDARQLPAAAAGAPLAPTPAASPTHHRATVVVDVR